jgi:hypothetical protein
VNTPPSCSPYRSAERALRHRCTHSVMHARAARRDLEGSWRNAPAGATTPHRKPRQRPRHSAYVTHFARCSVRHAAALARAVPANRGALSMQSDAMARLRRRRRKVGPRDRQHHARPERATRSRVERGPRVA